MTAKSLSPRPLCALQTLFSMYAARSLDVVSADARRERLDWARRNVGRGISSFRDLTDTEAGALIDLLKRALGQETMPANRVRSRRPRSLAGARAAGTEGRRDFSGAVSIATAEDLAPIDAMRQRLGWSRETFETWLRSPSSPLKRPDATLRTLADCNRVRWALKALLKRAGLWRETRRTATPRAASESVPQ